MSESGLRRPVVLAATGFLALTLLFVAHRQYRLASTHHEKLSDASTSLRRSNALRRPRTRWRPGFHPYQFSHNPTDQAVTHLLHRNQTGEEYGHYHNSYVLDSSNERLNTISLALLPRNLDPLYLAVRSLRRLTLSEEEQLRAHVHAVFLQNFLQDEYPEGYIIGEDVQKLLVALVPLGVDEEYIKFLVGEFDAGNLHVPVNWEPSSEDLLGSIAVPPHTDGAVEDLTAQDLLQALAGAQTGNETASDNGLVREGDEDPGGSQNMLDLLYQIAADQARREGFIHRGVECNSCGACPIQGIRYHCANCFDYDLCETCEAGQVHHRNHIFYKVRVPAPSRGHIKQVSPKWYPGNPNALPTSLPSELSTKLLKETGMDRTEMEALYEQFKCLAGHVWPTDPSELGMAIDRKGFDMYFTPTSQDRRPPPNLIYDRIFAFYDANADGLIGFEEYVRGLYDLQNKSRLARLIRIFRGYDLDSDGLVDRRDFLRMFRAYYALSKELNREMINSQEDFALGDEEIHEIVQSSQPISAAFGGSLHFGHQSRGGVDKEAAMNGDLAIVHGPNGVLQPESEMHGDRMRAIGNAAVGHRPRAHPFRTFRQEPAADDPVMMLPMQQNFELLGIQHADDATEEDLEGPDPVLQIYGWPPLLTPETEDVVQALGTDVPVEDIMDPVDRSRVFYAQSQRLDAESDAFLDHTRKRAVRERYLRRQFYLDSEEGMGKPPGYTEPDDSDDAGSIADKTHVDHDLAASSRRPSLRSRSSSKVRFEDSAVDTDYETRSNTSSRSMPLNERWGGFKLSEPEKDIGKDILYQAVQQGFNEMLDPLFKAKEDESIEVMATQSQRTKWAQRLADYEHELKMADSAKRDALRRADMIRTEELMAAGGMPPSPADLAEDVKQDGPDAQVYQSESARDELDAESIDSPSATDSSPPDPTLPQHRPDEVPAESFPRSREPSPEPPSVEILQLWLKHKRMEATAQERGGYGKLDFNEFKRKMVLESDAVATALGGETAVDYEEEVWHSSADLGKLSFVGTWLEMASF